MCNALIWFALHCIEFAWDWVENLSMQVQKESQVGRSLIELLRTESILSTGRHEIFYLEKNDDDLMYSWSTKNQTKEWNATSHIVLTYSGNVSHQKSICSSSPSRRLWYWSTDPHLLMWISQKILFLLKKLASSVDAIDISEIWNYQLLTDWLVL